MANPLIVESVSVHDLVLDPENARLHPDKNLSAIKGSLVMFGQREPLVVHRATNRVIGGNGRLEAMRALGWEDVSVTFVDCTAAEATALGLALNRTAETATWDTERLDELLARCKEDGLATADFGFDEAALDEIIARAHRDEADSAPVPAGPGESAAEVVDDGDEDIEIPAEAVTKPGDVYQLGLHRLMCGDSTSPADVAKLMASNQAALVFTSPPYGQQRDYGKKITDWDRLMSGVFEKLPITEDGQVLVNLGLIHEKGEWLPYWNHWLDAMRAASWRRFGLYVWDQGPGMPGDWNGRLGPAFELIFHFNKISKQANKTKDCAMAGQERNGGAGMRGADGKLGEWCGSKTVSDKKIPDNVIRSSRQRGSVGGHPAPFSVGFAKEIVEAYSNAGDILFEPFTGSGTLILAAEQLGRVCYGMELEPKYCDIVLARWAKAGGQTPELVARAGQ